MNARPGAPLTVLLAAAFALAPLSLPAAQPARQAQPARPALPLQPSLPLEIDQSYDLNFASKHIVETAFEAALEVALPGRSPRQPTLTAGAEVRAARIDLTLHDVRGHADFHASTQRLHDVLRAHSLP